MRYAPHAISAVLLQQTAVALTQQDPSTNPYLQWIVTGHHPTTRPYALRAENFTAIRANLDCLEWHCYSLEQFLASAQGQTFDRYNLSNIFEYMSPTAYQALLEQICDRSRPGARLVYWNLFVHRQCPAALAGRLRSLTQLQAQLNAQDQAFFYQTVVVEAVR